MTPEHETEAFLKESEPYTDPTHKLGFLRQARQYACERLEWKRDRPITLSPFLSHFMVFILTSITWGSILGFVIHNSSANNRYLGHHNDRNDFRADAKYLNCGTSVEESKSLGCKYDILSNHWVPGPCLDQNAVKEYQTDGSWYGFADRNRTQLLSIETMADMEFYYTSERDHIVHCAMLWRKQFRAFFEERTYYDSIIADPIHTLHCSQFLIDRTERGLDYRNMPIKTRVGHAGCWVRD